MTRLSGEISSIVALLGLTLLAAGCALVYPPLALIVPGTVLLLLPVVGALDRGRRQ